MKINLAENMLRFGVKNLNETATSKVKTLAEQTLGKPAATTSAVPGKPAATAVAPAVTTKKTYKNISVNSSTLNWDGDRQKSEMYVNLTPSKDNKSYLIEEILFESVGKQADKWSMGLTVPLTYTPPLPNNAFDKLIPNWADLLVKTLTALDLNAVTKLNMFIKIPGGSTNTYSVAPSKSIANKQLAATEIATAIVNGISEAKINS